MMVWLLHPRVLVETPLYSTTQTPGVMALLMEQTLSFPLSAVDDGCGTYDQGRWRNGTWCLSPAAAATTASGSAIGFRWLTANSFVTNLTDCGGT